MILSKPVSYSLLITALAISLLGVVMIFSASGNIAIKYDLNPLAFGTRQIIHLCLAVAAYLIIVRIPNLLFCSLRTLLLLICFALLIAVLIPGIGVETNGAQRWLRLYLVYIQPVEITKVVLIVFCAGLLRQSLPLAKNINTSLQLIAITFALALLLMIQPDFSGTLIILCISIGMLFIAGLSWVLVGGFTIVAGILMAIVIYLNPEYWHRVLIAFDPWLNPTGDGYQMVNAMIAIARGGWFGSGLGNSIQKHFYLPEAHTDFLLAITIEELGIISLIILSSLYAGLLIQILLHAKHAWQAGNSFGYLLCWGVFCMIAVQTSVAIGVNLAILPTTGIPLPLFSFGGSSIVATYVALGMVTTVRQSTSEQRLTQTERHSSMQTDEILRR